MAENIELCGKFIYLGLMFYGSPAEIIHTNPNHLLLLSPDRSRRSLAFEQPERVLRQRKLRCEEEQEGPGPAGAGGAVPGLRGPGLRLPL